MAAGDVTAACGASGPGWSRPRFQPRPPDRAGVSPAPPREQSDRRGPPDPARSVRTGPPPEFTAAVEGAGDSGEVAGKAGAVDVAGEAVVKGADAGEVEVAVKGAVEGEGELTCRAPPRPVPPRRTLHPVTGAIRRWPLASFVVFGVRGLVGVDVSARGRWRRDRKGRRLANEFPRPGRPGFRGIRGDGAGLGSHGSSRPARPDGPLAHAVALVGRDLEPARLPCCRARSCGGHRQAAARGATSAATAACRRSASFLSP